MPRLPARVQYGDHGNTAAAPASTTVTVGRAQPPRPALLQRGPAQAQEQFISGSVDPEVNRALGQMQTNIAKATAQAKAAPWANGVLLDDVILSDTWTTTIKHGLGTAALGFFVTNVSNGTISERGGIVSTGDTNLDKTQCGVRLAYSADDATKPTKASIYVWG